MLEMSRCPDCGAEYPVWYSPKGELGCFCDNCGYATADTKERLDR